MDRPSALPVGPSPSWQRVVIDTIKLTWGRRWAFRVEGSDQSRSRRWVPVLCGLVLLGGGLLAQATVGSGDPQPAAPAPVVTPRSQQPTDPISPPARSAAQPSRAATTRTASPARAAAGTEIAERTDITVTPAAATALRQGKVDGRLLVLLAALATADLLTLVDVPPDVSLDAGDLEMGVADVDRVLQWLDLQSRLRPDRMEVRREASISRLRLTYVTPEPPGLFPS